MRDLYVVHALSTAAPAAAEPNRTFQDIGDAYRGLSDARGPVPWSDPREPAPISLLRDFDVGRAEPSLEDVFDRFVRSYTGRYLSKAESLSALDLECLVSPEQAASGAILSIAVPVIHACPVCGGSGRDRLYLCTGCGGQGVIATEAPVRFQVPARLRDGDIVQLSLEPLGARDQVLRICFRVGA